MFKGDRNYRNFYEDSTAISDFLSTRSDEAELNNDKLYKSRIDNICELKTLKDTLISIKSKDDALYTRLMSRITD
jgi:hypothetical protein